MKGRERFISDSAGRFRCHTVALFPQFHFGPFPQPVGAVHDHHITGGQTGLYGGLSTLYLTHADRADGHGPVGVDQIDEGTLGALLDGRRRDDDDILSDLRQQAGIDELVGEQLIILVFKQGLKPHGPGVGIDLIVDGQKMSHGQLFALITVKGHNLRPPAGLELAEHLGNVVLGQGKDDRDGLKLGDDHQPVGVGGMDDIPRIHQTQTDPAADRGRDPAVDQLQLGVIDLPLVGLDRPFVLPHQGLLGVELLFGDGVLLPEIPVSLQVEDGVLQERLVAGHLTLGLGQLDLERPRDRFGPGVGPLLTI